MPTGNETKPCSVTGCLGTMVYHVGYVPPGGSASFAGDGGSPQFVEPHGAWVCNKNENHEDHEQ